MVRPRRFTDAELLKVARSCFLQHGPAVSTARIAEEAGVSQATLFKRFGTKDQLMLQALLPSVDQGIWDALHAPLDARPIFEQIIEKGDLMVAFFNQMQPCFAMLRAHSSVVLDDMAKRGTAPPMGALRALQTFFDAAVAAGRMKPTHTESLALAWLGALRNRAFWNHTMPSTEMARTDHEYVRDLTELLWRGLAPEEHTA